jgi:hypothetical protein
MRADELFKMLDGTHEYTPILLADGAFGAVLQWIREYTHHQIMVHVPARDSGQDGIRWIDAESIDDMGRLALAERTPSGSPPDYIDPDGLRHILRACGHYVTIGILKADSTQEITYPDAALCPRCALREHSGESIPVVYPDRLPEQQPVHHA